MRKPLQEQRPHTHQGYWNVDEREEMEDTVAREKFDGTSTPAYLQNKHNKGLQVAPAPPPRPPPS